MPDTVYIERRWSAAVEDAVAIASAGARKARVPVPGNLVGRSQTMMSGYKNQPDKTREGYWTHPETGQLWQRMGDIGRLDADGSERRVSPSLST